MPFYAIFRKHWQASLILAAFMVLASLYSIITPPFEAGDESRHYAVVKYIADTGRLPVQEPGDPQIHWSHEGNQPPLYYALAAALTAHIETGTWDEVYWYNPHTTIGDPLRPDNKNITIHPPGESWQSHGLAVHLIRAMSIVMAAVTVATTYIVALNLFQGQRQFAVGAMALTAFTPMFIFISASVNNDNAVIMFVTLALWQMTSLVRRPPPRRMIVWHAALLGLLIGLGALSKLYALGLIPLAGVMFGWLAIKLQGEVDQPGATSFRPLVRMTHWMAMLLLVVVMVAGWFYLRNMLLYDGDILALQAMRETAGQRDAVPSLATLLAEFQGFRIAYWGLFGGVNVLADPWIYRVLDLMSLIAAVGLLAFVGRTVLYRTIRPAVHISRRVLGLLGGWLLIMIAGFIVWNLTQPAGQGRLFYPAIAAISSLATLGVTWWLPPHVRWWGIGGWAAGLFVFAVVSPFAYIAPAYDPPPRLTEADVPADIQAVDFIHADTMRLVGYQLETPVVRPAESLKLTVYWELLQPAALDYSIFVHVMGRDREVIAQRDTYPGGGLWPTRLLEPGDILADTYEIRIPPQTEFDHAPTRLILAAGIYDWREPGRPGKSAVNADGDPVEPIIGTAKLIPWQWPDVPRSDSPVNFADAVTLLSHDIAPDQQTLTLNWAVEQPLETDYTVFIQAWRDGEYIAGFDGPPVGGDYPTSLWAPGDIIIDDHALDPASLPPGTYDILVGWYDPLTDERLPASDAAGVVPDYAVPLDTLTVE